MCCFLNLVNLVASGTALVVVEMPASMIWNAEHRSQLLSLAIIQNFQPQHESFKQNYNQKIFPSTVRHSSPFLLELVLQFISYQSKNKWTRKEKDDPKYFQNHCKNCVQNGEPGTFKMPNWINTLKSTRTYCQKPQYQLIAGNKSLVKLNANTANKFKSYSCWHFLTQTGRNHHFPPRHLSGFALQVDTNNPF